MARRKRGTPEQQARRALIGELLSTANVQSMDDIQELFKILPEAKEWQQKPLESVYAVVFLDAIHYHVRSEG